MSSIAKLGPASFKRNSLGHERCITLGNMLLDRIKREGMSDKLDQEIAAYIDKAKITVREMNGRRAPITQLFDQIRKVYTSLENDVDPTKKGTVPAQLQAIRDAYAAKKREAAEAARRAEAVRVAHDNAITKYRADVNEDFKAQLNRFIISQINALLDLDRRLNVENYDIIEDGLRNYPVTLPENWGVTVQPSVPLPYELTPQECTDIQRAVLMAALPKFKEQFQFELTTNRDDLVDRLPSKFKELQKIAEAERADAERAAKLKAEMEEKERAEAARKEQERQRREAEAKAAAELQAQKSEMDGLFGAAMVAQAEYQPKTSVKKRLVIKTPEAFMNIVGLWWSQEGCTLSIDELSKIFKKQITFCEKLANDKDNPMTIDSPYVDYVEEVKAR